MLEYIEKLLKDGIHLESKPKLRKNGFYQLDFTHSAANGQISIRMNEIGEDDRVTEYEVAEILRTTVREENGVKTLHSMEIPKNMFRTRLHFYQDMNAFGTPGILTF